MKEKVKYSLKQLTANKYLFALAILLFVQTIIFVVILSFSIKYNDRQLITHYSAFGGTYFYFGQWFYSFVFVFFGLIVAISHIIISIKLLIIKGHSLAIAYMWFGIGVVALGWIMASQILELQALL